MENKFRAWSDKWDRMIYPDDPEYTIDVHNHTAWLESVDDEMVKLSQCVCNYKGKDIYLFDIVNMSSEFGDYGKHIIVFDENRFSIHVLDAKDFQLWENDEHINNLSSFQLREILQDPGLVMEVVGNVYENEL